MKDDASDALGLWTTVAPYSTFPCETISWRLLPALHHGQYRVYRRDGIAFGFASWGFMTHQEFLTRDYDGREVFAREDGDVLVVVDMIAPHGQNDVLCICRDLRRYFKAQYPNVESVLAHRFSRDGIFPNKGG